MRRFSADYLEQTREGMWADSREALADLSLSDRKRVLDVGCGTGELTRVLASELPETATVVGVDADLDLLGVAREYGDGGDRTNPDTREDEGRRRDDGHRDGRDDGHRDGRDDGHREGRDGGHAEGRDDRSPEYASGDATRLPFLDNAFDLVVCQALLINLPEPRVAIREFARVSADCVAAIEPNNAAVDVSSTVTAEETLEREAREAYLAGVGTNVALGDRVRDLFRVEGLENVSVRRYVHEKRVEPPYSEAALHDAARKASGAGLADHRDELEASLSGEDYADLRRRWRSMGREVVGEMQDGTYERVEEVPFDVTVGHV